MSPIDKQLMLASGQLISVSQASRKTPYSAEYLSLLARKGRLKAIKLSRDWFTTEDAVREYTKKQVKKHKMRLQLFEKLTSHNEAGFVNLKAGIYLGLIGISSLILAFSLFTQIKGASVGKDFLSWNNNFISGSVRLVYQTKINDLKALDSTGKQIYEINKSQLVKDIKLAENNLTILTKWPKWQALQIQEQAPKMFTLAPISQEINKTKLALKNLNVLFKQGEIILAESFIQKVDGYSSWQSKIVKNINNSVNGKFAKGQIFADKLARSFDYLAFSYSRALSNSTNLLVLQFKDLKDSTVVAFGEFAGIPSNESILVIKQDSSRYSEHSNRENQHNISELINQHATDLSNNKQVIEHSDQPNTADRFMTGNQNVASRFIGKQQGSVLGESTSQVASIKQQALGKTPGQILAVVDSPQINSLIDLRLNEYLVQGKFKGEKGDKGETGSQGSSSVSYPSSIFGYAAPNGSGGQGAGNIFSATYLTGNTVKATESLVITGPLTQSGGAVTLATTTITNLTTTTFNPGLTQGSVAFMGSSGFTQDNANFYWDDVTNRLGLGTASPSSLLHVAGAGRFGVASTTAGTIIIQNSINAYTTTIQSSSTQSSNLTLTLPPTAGSSGNALLTGGDGTLYWGSAGSTLSGGVNGLVARWTAADTLSTGLLIDNGTVAGVNATSSTITFNVQGSASIDPFNIASSSGTSFFVVKESGNIGIGTTTPAQKLSVVGNINIDPLSSYMQDNQQILYASTTNFSTLVGFGAGAANTSTGLYNTFTGYQAGNANTTGDRNIALGYQSLYQSTTQFDNIAIGFQSMYSTIANGADNNVAIGYETLYADTSGDNNIAIGQSALDSNTTGDGNIGIGAFAGQGLISNADNNIAIGTSALFFASTNNSDANIAIGYQAISFATSPAGNTAVGTHAGYGTYGQSYSNNVIMGYYAGNVLSTGSNNTLLGYQSGQSLKTGSNNIVIGYDIDTPAVDSTNTLNIGNLIFGTGLDGADTTLSTGNVGIGTTSPVAKLSVQSTAGVNDIFELSTSTGVSVLRVDYQGNVGIGTSSPSYKLDVYRSTDGDVAGFTDANGSCTINPTSTALICSSDSRLKRDVNELEPTLEKVLGLRSVNFKWINQTDDANRLGFIAQEVEKIFPEVVHTNQKGFKSVAYSNFVPLLVKSIQEQQEMINNLQGANIGGNLDGDTQIIVKKHIVFNKDTVGRARILAGSTRVRISFEQEYKNQPIVTATPSGKDWIGTDISFAVTEEDATGFAIEISKSYAVDLEFNWHAFAGEDTKLTVSDGSTKDIVLLQPQAAAAFHNPVDSNQNTVNSTQQEEETGEDNQELSDESNSSDNNNQKEVVGSDSFNEGENQEALEQQGDSSPEAKNDNEEEANQEEDSSYQSNESNQTDTINTTDESDASSSVILDATSEEEVIRPESNGQEDMGKTEESFDLPN